MTKSKLLVLLAMLPLSACVTAMPVAASRSQAKAAASFCAVAEYQPDPAGTDPDKASNNAKGRYLRCPWAKP